MKMERLFAEIVFDRLGWTEAEIRKEIWFEHSR
jgi:hypothetical protein